MFYTADKISWLFFLAAFQVFEYIHPAVPQTFLNVNTPIYSVLSLHLWVPSNLHKPCFSGDTQICTEYQWWAEFRMTSCILQARLQLIHSTRVFGLFLTAWHCSCPALACTFICEGLLSNQLFPILYLHSPLLLDNQCVHSCNTGWYSIVTSKPLPFPSPWWALCFPALKWARCHGREIFMSLPPNSETPGCTGCPPLCAVKKKYFLSLTSQCYTDIKHEIFQSLRSEIFDIFWFRTTCAPFKYSDCFIISSSLIYRHYLL